MVCRSVMSMCLPISTAAWSASRCICRLPTGADGQFSLFLSDGGTYYIGARSAFGGPLEPGEWVGTFDGQPDHSVTVARGAKDDLGTIIVKEFW